MVYSVGNQVLSIDSLSKGDAHVSVPLCHYRACKRRTEEAAWPHLMPSTHIINHY